MPLIMSTSEKTMIAKTPIKDVNGVNAANTVPDKGTLTKAKPESTAARNKRTCRSNLFPPLKWLITVYVQGSEYVLFVSKVKEYDIG